MFYYCGIHLNYIGTSDDVCSTFGLFVCFMTLNIFLCSISLLMLCELNVLLKLIKFLCTTNKKGYHQAKVRKIINALQPLKRFQSPFPFSYLVVFDG